MNFDLHPGQGVHTLKFGDLASTAREIFGAATERTHSDCFSLEFERHGLTLFFTEKDNLSRVFVEGASAHVCLFERPISQIFSDYPGLSDLAAWISSLGYESASPDYAFGVHDLQIPALNLSFVVGEDGYTGIDLTPAHNKPAMATRSRPESIDFRNSKP